MRSEILNISVFKDNGCLTILWSVVIDHNGTFFQLCNRFIQKQPHDYTDLLYVFNSVLSNSSIKCNAQTVKIKINYTALMNMTTFYLDY